MLAYSRPLQCCQVLVLVLPSSHASNCGVLMASSRCVSLQILKELDAFHPVEIIASEGVFFYLLRFMFQGSVHLHRHIFFVVCISIFYSLLEFVRLSCTWVSPPSSLRGNVSQVGLIQYVQLGLDMLACLSSYGPSYIARLVCIEVSGLLIIHQLFSLLFYFFTQIISCWLVYQHMVVLLSSVLGDKYFIVPLICRSCISVCFGDIYQWPLCNFFKIYQQELPCS